MTKRNSDRTQFRNIHRIFGNCQFHDLSLRPQLRLSSTAYRFSANHPSGHKHNSCQCPCHFTPICNYYLHSLGYPMAPTTSRFRQRTLSEVCSVAERFTCSFLSYSHSVNSVNRDSVNRRCRPQQYDRPQNKLQVPIDTPNFHPCSMRIMPTQESHANSACWQNPIYPSVTYPRSAPRVMHG